MSAEQDWEDFESCHNCHVVVNVYKLVTEAPKSEEYKGVIYTWNCPICKMGNKIWC